MNELPLIRSGLLDRFPQFRCALSSKRGTGSDDEFGWNMSYNVGDRREVVDANRRRFFSVLDIPPDRLAIPRQCHSSRVEAVTAPGYVDATDGLITDHQNLWLAISVADCTPVFLVDPVQNVVAAVHAGWRGSAGMIVSKAVETMKSGFRTKPEDLVVFIGPSAGVCCYEIGEDVAGRFGSEVLQERDGKRFLNLKDENARQLREAGIRERNIDVSPICTICNRDFHSYRRDRDRSGRMMGVVGIVGKL